jgi:hypothetical protein
MYARVIASEESDTYEKDMAKRLSLDMATSGTRCVVRIKTDQTDKQFGLEYGGIVRELPTGTVLLTRRAYARRTNCKVALLPGANNMLMSTGSGSRPIGYILSEDFATQEIKADDRVEELIGV